MDIAREAAAMDPGSLSLALELHIAEGRYSSVAKAAGDLAEEGRLSRPQQAWKESRQRMAGSTVTSILLKPERSGRSPAVLHRGTVMQRPVNA